MRSLLSLCFFWGGLFCFVFLFCFYHRLIVVSFPFCKDSENFLKFIFKETYLFSFYMPNPFPTPSPPSAPSIFLPNPHPISILSSKRVRLPMGSQQSLAHCFEARPRLSPTIARLSKVFLQRE